MARALECAHDQDIIHRDLKPANIHIDRRQQVRVLDFGLARSTTDDELTQPGTLLGSPHYMAPEQAFGAPAEVDHRADLYSLGTILYELLSGRRPFEAGTLLGILRKIDEEEPASLLRPGLKSTASRSERTRIRCRCSCRGDQGHRLQRLLGRHGLAAADLSRAIETGDDHPELRVRYLLDQLASARSWMQFAMPGLFPSIDLQEVEKIELHLDETDAPEIYRAVVSGIRICLDGDLDGAQEPLKMALALGLSEVDFFIVRGVSESLLATVDLSLPEAQEMLSFLVSELDDVLGRFPDALNLHALRVFALTSIGDVHRATEFADELLSLAPSAAETHVIRALLFQRKGRFEEALESYRIAARLDPQLDLEGGCAFYEVPALLARGGNRHELDEITAWIDEHLSRRVDPIALLLRAFVEMIRENVNQAAEHLALLHRSLNPEMAIPLEWPLGELLQLALEPSPGMSLFVARSLHEQFGNEGAVTRLCSRLVKWLDQPDIADRDRLSSEERHQLKMDSRFTLAVIAAGRSDENEMITNLTAVLEAGLPVSTVENEGEFVRWRDHPRFRQLIEQHRK